MEDVLDVYARPYDAARPTAFGQGPAALVEGDCRWGWIGESAQSGLSLGRDSGRGTAPMIVRPPVQSVAVEGVERGLYRVRLASVEASDRGRLPALGVDYEGFGAA